MIQTVGDVMSQLTESNIERRWKRKKVLSWSFVLFMALCLLTSKDMTFRQRENCSILCMDKIV